MIERAPKDIPILFSTPMVLAIRADRKTATRRLALRPGSEMQPSAWTKVKPGDLLWVRETWRASYGHDWHREDLGRCPKPTDIPAGDIVEYVADGTHELGGKNRVAIHMPRWVSRFTLEVEEAHVERLGAMRTKDALAEGIEHDPPKARSLKGFWKEYVVRMGAPGTDIRGMTAVECFENLWEHIHGEGSWMDDKGKDVVVITFAVHKMNIDAFKAQRSAA